MRINFVRRGLVIFAAVLAVGASFSIPLSRQADVSTVDKKKLVEMHPEYDTAKELVVRMSFPDKASEEKDVFLFHPRAMVADSKNNFYVVDDAQVKILKFKSDGTFLKTIGRRGQGPGEFSMPANLFITKDNRILVRDIYGHKVQSFTPEGEFLKSLTIAQTFGSFVERADGSLFVNCFSRKATWDIPFAIISGEGTSFSSVGEIRFKAKKPVRLFSSVASNENGDIFAFFQELNLIHKYSADGSFIKSVSLDFAWARDSQEYNLNGDQKRFRIIMKSGKIFQGNIYVLVPVPFSPASLSSIIEMSSDLKIIRIFYFNQLGLHINDFAVVNEEGEILFALLEDYPEAQVHICGIRKYGERP